MNTFFCIAFLALAALSLSANGHEWKCKGETANLSTELVKVFQKCHTEAGEDDTNVPEDEQRINKFYDIKCCMWKDETYMVVDHEGNFHWDKLKEMSAKVFGNGVGEAVVDKVKENCHDKVEGVKFEPKEPKGIEFTNCIIQTMHKECHEGE